MRLPEALRRTEARMRLASADLYSNFADHIRLSVFGFVGSATALALVSRLVPTVNFWHELMILVACGVLGPALVVSGGFIVFLQKTRNDPRLLTAAHTSYRAIPALSLAVMIILSVSVWELWPAPDPLDRSVPPLLWSREIGFTGLGWKDQVLARDIQFYGINNSKHEVKLEDAFIRSATTGQTLQMRVGFVGGRMEYFRHQSDSPVSQDTVESGIS